MLCRWTLLFLLIIKGHLWSLQINAWKPCNYNIPSTRFDIIVRTKTSVFSSIGISNKACLSSWRQYWLIFYVFKVRIGIKIVMLTADLLNPGERYTRCCIRSFINGYAKIYFQGRLGSRNFQIEIHKQYLSPMGLIWSKWK